MAEIRHLVDYNHGPVVTITIGLSFIEEGRRRSRGDVSPARQTVQAVIHTELATTLVADQLWMKLDPGQADLSYKLRVPEITFLEPVQRPEAIFSIGIPEIGPLFKGVRAIVMPLPGPIQCFLGRNFLNVNKSIFIYDGEYEIFSLKASGIML